MIRFLEYSILYIAVIILQVLLFDHIHIETYALVNISILFVALLPLDMKEWRVLIVSTLLGVAIDALTALPAINTIAITFIGFIRRPCINLILGNKDETKRGVATSKSMGNGKYITFLLVLVFIQNSIIFTLETTSINEILFTIIRIVSSTISSLFFVYLLHLPLFRRVERE